MSNVRSYLNKIRCAELCSRLVPRERDRLQNEGVDLADPIAVAMALGADTTGGATGCAWPIWAWRDDNETGPRYAVIECVGWTPGPIFFTDTDQFLLFVGITREELAASGDPEFVRLAEGYGASAETARRLLALAR